MIDGLLAVISWVLPVVALVSFLLFFWLVIRASGRPDEW
jgi:hypothetical protein